MERKGHRVDDMIRRPIPTIADGVAAAALLCGLPLLGLLLAGTPLRPYLEFPPLTQYVQHAPFSWPVFAALAGLITAVMLPFVLRIARAWRTTPAATTVPARSFPWWGWAAVAFGAVAWVLAWTRWAWFEPFQPFTFSPLWFAYIAAVNALVWRRTGRSMLTHAPAQTAGLFALSAAFWWYFEYLNRFVQNWHYVNVAALTPWQYVVFATLPFSTVLPAVMGTYDLLAAYPRSAAGLDRAWRLRLPNPRTAGLCALLAAGAGLAAVGAWPDWLFPLLWVAPLVVIVALQLLRRRPTVMDNLARGDWSHLFRLALASLICGFFWEMWNWGSLARWEYSVPFVNRFHIFEMPLLGYAGYLPFGVECAVIAECMIRRKRS